ncbi:MAG: ABC transporter substrate-binding protein, partial [Actinomycetia bacterium]|nr:ABC transporter substrate-binding protein [Actinomycetes bacterium]
LRKQINDRALKGMYRGGWQMDYPSIENFLAPIYATGASSNDTDYSSATFDGLLKQAAAATDPATANGLYQQAEAQLNIDFPTMPLWYQQSQFIYSTKIKSVKMTPFSTFDFSSIVLK